MAGMLNDNGDDLFRYLRLRNELPADSPLHAIYGPLEHGQFTEETVTGNPLMALPLAVATPAYTAAKATGMLGARSPASMAEMLEAYKGIGRGLATRAKPLAQGALDWLVPNAYAHHEQSETIQGPDGRWINVYGRQTPRAGQQLPGTDTYETVGEAERAARARSEEAGKRSPPTTPAEAARIWEGIGPVSDEEREAQRAPRGMLPIDGRMPSRKLPPRPSIPPQVGVRG